MSDFMKHLKLVLTHMGVKFSLHGASMPTEDVLSDVGMMPAIAKRADQLSQLCLGYGIGVTFEEAAETKLGKRVKFDEVTPSILRCLCIIDVINELSRSKDMKGVTPLDELMYD